MGGRERARTLRRNMSPAERRLWAVLRKRPRGFKFRSQHPCDPYTLDFYCYAAALAIEIDGSSHDMGDNPRRDERRDLLLASRGIKTLRFLATDVRDHLEAVLTQILEECASRSPSTGFAGPPPLQRQGRT
jgi:very-short-patch-repair endonuclease